MKYRKCGIMTNQEIIKEELINQGLFTESQIDLMIIQYGCIPAKSYAEWQRLGFQVKNGEKSFIKCLLWNPKMVKEDHLISESSEEFTGTYFRKMTSLFLFNQVQKR